MAKKNLNVIIGAIDRISKPVRAISRVIDKVTAPVDRVNRALNKLGREAGIKKLNRSLRQSARHAKSAAKGIGKIVAVSALLGGLATGPILGFAKSYADAGDNIAKTSHRLGISVGALQELRFVADRSGVSVSAFDTAVQRFSGIAGEAARGVGEGAKAFDLLGVSFKNADGSMRGTEDVLIDTLKALEKIENPLQRNSVAMKIFGTRGTAMVQMTKDGAGSIEKLTSEFNKLGAKIGDDAAKAAEEFTDKSSNLGVALSGLRNRIGGQLLPVLTPMIEKFTQLAVNYGPSVSRWAEKFAGKLPDRLNKLWSGLKKVGSVLSAIGRFASWVDDKFGLVNTVMTVFAGVIAFQVVSAVASLALAFKGLGVAIALTPIGLMVAGIAVVVAGLLFVSRNWTAIQAGISVGLSVVGDAFKSLGKKVIDVFKFIASVNPFVIILKSINGAVAALTGFNVLGAISEKLQNLLPDWAVDLLGLEKSSAPVQAGIPNARAEVGGTLHVKIDSEGRPRVKELRSDNPNVGVAVDVGVAMGGI